MAARLDAGSGRRGHGRHERLHRSPRPALFRDGPSGAPPALRGAALRLGRCRGPPGPGRWGRFAAAAVVRLSYYLAGQGSSLEILIYVDDLLMLATNKAEIIFAGALLFTIVAFGIPLRWDKCLGGPQVEWPTL